MLAGISVLHTAAIRHVHRHMPQRKRKQPEASSPGKQSAKSPKQDSHLYTDDNPSTTVHGTGFQDTATAEKTIDLVQKRSLAYQFQVINTMFHRAKHHPHPNARMEGAMDVFSKWLEQYPAKKHQLHIYKKASRPLVEAYLKALDQQQIQPSDSDLLVSEPFQQALTRARTYVTMPPGKRLANTLTSSDPQDPDMESLRLAKLQMLVPEESQQQHSKAWQLSEGNHQQVSDLHLQWILWGYTPAEKQAMVTLHALVAR